MQKKRKAAKKGFFFERREKLLNVCTAAMAMNKAEYYYENMLVAVFIKAPYLYGCMEMIQFIGFKVFIFCLPAFTCKHT